MSMFLMHHNKIISIYFIVSKFIVQKCLFYLELDNGKNPFPNLESIKLRIFHVNELLLTFNIITKK